MCFHNILHIQYQNNPLLTFERLEVRKVDGSFIAMAVSFLFLEASLGRNGEQLFIMPPKKKQNVGQLCAVKHCPNTANTQYTFQFAIEKNVNRKVHSQYRMLKKIGYDLTDKVCSVHRVQQPLKPLKNKIAKNSIRSRLRGDPSCTYHILNLLPTSSESENDIVVTRCSHSVYTVGCTSCSIMIVISFEHRRKDWINLSNRTLKLYEVKLELLIDSLTGGQFVKRNQFIY